VVEQREELTARVATLEDECRSLQQQQQLHQKVINEHKALVLQVKNIVDRTVYDAIHEDKEAVTTMLREAEEKLNNMVDRATYEAACKDSKASAKKLQDAERELKHVREQVQTMISHSVLKNALREKEELGKRVKILEEQRLDARDKLRNCTTYIKTLPSPEEHVQTSLMLEESQAIISD
jgi:hypothetical protein